MPDKRARKRWPATNTDELVRHVARQFPDLTRRQVAGVLNLAMHSILQSLGDQVAAGFDDPAVKIRNFGTLYLRWYKPTRRPHLNGSVRVIPPRWKFGFRAAAQWGPRLDQWSALTRNTSEEQPTEPQPENLEWPHRDEEAVPPLPDLRADRR